MTSKGRPDSHPEIYTAEGEAEPENTHPSTVTPWAAVELIILSRVFLMVSPMKETLSA